LASFLEFFSLREQPRILTMGKDPNAPTRPLTPYFRFAATQRAALTKKGLVGIKAAPEIAKLWAKLSESQKTKFQTAYNKERTTYNKAFAKYKITDDYAEYRKLQKARTLRKAQIAAKKDPARPRKPASGFQLYANSVRDEVSDDLESFSIGASAKVIGQRWKKLSAAEKKKWQAKAKGAQVKYAKAVKAYRETDSYKKHKANLDRLSGKAAKDKEMEKAKKARARTAAKNKAQKAKDAKARKKATAAKRKAAAAKKKATKKAASAKKKATLAKKKAAAAKKKALAKKKKAAKKASKKKSKAKKASKKRKPSKKVVKKRSAARRSKKRVVKRRK